MSCGFDLKDEGVVESVFVGQRIAAMDLKQKRPAESSFSSIIIHPSTDLKPNLTFNVREEHALRNTKMHDLQLQSAPSVNHNPETNGVDPRVALRNLYLLEQRILQVKDVIKSIISHQGQLSHQASDLTGQRQLVAADLTCIIIQLISTAGSLLPNIGSTPLSANPSVLRNESQRQDDILSKEAVNDLTGCDGGGEEQEKCLDSSSGDCYESFAIDELELKDSSYEVLQLEEEEILAPHAHFCAICGKGFKRDANLRMHMRGHGDEYKTAAALAKPSKEGGSEQQAAAAARRYSCPFAGCKRNKEHKKFQPLKTLLCVKNHYKRSHCNKSFTCGRCNSKRFSVLADLKTHEKHCGRGKWACSCGTTFSRKDKLFGHVALFRGHTPALPTEDVKSSAAIPAAAAAHQNLKFNFCASTSNSGGIHGGDDGWSDFFSVDFDSFDLFGEFSHSAFDVPDSNLFFLPGESSFSSAPRNGEN